MQEQEIECANGSSEGNTSIVNSIIWHIYIAEEQWMHQNTEQNSRSRLHIKEKNSTAYKHHSWGERHSNSTGILEYKTITLNSHHSLGFCYSGKDVNKMIRRFSIDYLLHFQENTCLVQLEPGQECNAYLDALREDKRKLSMLLQLNENLIGCKHMSNHKSS